MSHGPLLADEALTMNGERQRKRKNFMWPAAHLGWSIHHIPGLDSNVKATYLNQYLPADTAE